METIERRELVADVERLPQISWGAVIAGLVLVIGISWLMFLLGSAIGVGVADANDIASAGNLQETSQELGIGAIIWMLLTSIVAFLLGGLLAGRLTGKPDRTVGMLHGVTLWSISTALMIWLGYLGISGLMQTGQSLVKGAVNASAAIGSTATSGASAAGEAADDLVHSPIINSIQAQLKRKASEILAQAEATGGANVSQREAKQAITQIDDTTLKTIAEELVAGNTDGAKQALAENTELSQQEINEVVDGIAGKLEQQTQQNPAENPTLLNDIQESLKQRTSRLLANADATGGTEITRRQADRALSQLDARTLQTVALQLMQGNTKAAKDALAVNTDLSEAQINDIIDGISKEVDQEVQQLQNQLKQTAETAADYTEAVLWTAFISSALGLVVAIIGGWFGTNTVRRLHFAFDSERAA